MQRMWTRSNGDLDSHRCIAFCRNLAAPNWETFAVVCWLLPHAHGQTMAALIFCLGCYCGLRLNAPLTQFLYLKTKDANAGGQDDGGRVFHPHQPMTSEPHDVFAYATGPEFRESNEVDFALYQKANATLDSAVRSIPGFAQMLARYNELQRSAKACESEPKPCFWTDLGCGYKCLDRITG
jgi:hypothetical protein